MLKDKKRPKLTLFWQIDLTETFVKVRLKGREPMTFEGPATRITRQMDELVIRRKGRPTLTVDLITGHASEANQLDLPLEDQPKPTSGSSPA